MTTYNDPKRIDIWPAEHVEQAAKSKTVGTDSDVLKRIELLRRQGEVLFEQIAPQLNRLQPGRERTDEEFQQVCVALALFVHHLLDSGDD